MIEELHTRIKLSAETSQISLTAAAIGQFSLGLYDV